MSLLKPRKPAKATAQAPAPASAPAFEERLLRLADVCPMVGLGKTSIYAMIRDGKFPPQSKHGTRASHWKLSEVQAYIRGEWQPLHASAPVLKLICKKGGRA
jgi:prophage regulatory protein